MFDDDDNWPMKCPSCGFKLLKKVGWLKANTTFVCSGCPTRLHYNAEALMVVLDRANEMARDFNVAIKLDRVR